MSTEKNSIRQSTPYTQRSLAEIQDEIDAYEERYPHDQLPPRYDALVAFRNQQIKHGDTQ